MSILNTLYYRYLSWILFGLNKHLQLNWKYLVSSYEPYLKYLAFKIFIKWIFFEKTLPDFFTFMHYFLTLICAVKLYPDCKNEKQEYFEQKHFVEKVKTGERIYFLLFLVAVAFLQPSDGSEAPCHHLSKLFLFVCFKLNFLWLLHKNEIYVVLDVCTFCNCDSWCHLNEQTKLNLY